MSAKNAKSVPPVEPKKKGKEAGDKGGKPPGGDSKGPGGSNNKGPGGNSKGPGSNGKHDKNKKPMKDEVKKDLSYNKNTPMMIMVGIFLFFIMYNLLKHMRNKDNIMKHKINTEIRRKLYFKDEYDGE